MKSYTDIDQSKKLAEILPLESADMWYSHYGNSKYNPTIAYKGEQWFLCQIRNSLHDIPCWSLAALLNILHFRQNDISSLSGGGYKDGKYISDWCLDYEYDNGDYQKTFADNPVDACYEMIVRLELKNT